MNKIKLTEDLIKGSKSFAILLEKAIYKTFPRAEKGTVSIGEDMLLFRIDGITICRDFSIQMKEARDQFNDNKTKLASICIAIDLDELDNDIIPDEKMSQADLMIGYLVESLSKSINVDQHFKALEKTFLKFSQSKRISYKTMINEVFKASGEQRMNADEFKEVFKKIQVIPQGFIQLASSLSEGQLVHAKNRIFSTSIVGYVELIVIDYQTNKAMIKISNEHDSHFITRDDYIEWNFFTSYNHKG